MLLKSLMPPLYFNIYCLFISLRLLLIHYYSSIRWEVAALLASYLTSTHLFNLLALFPSFVWSQGVGLGDRSTKVFQLQRIHGNNSHSRALMERQATKKWDQISCKVENWDRHFCFLLAAECPKRWRGVFDVGCVLSPPLFLLFLLSSGCFKSSLFILWVVIYFIHFFHLSICIKQRLKAEKCSLWGKETSLLVFITKLS